MTTPANLPELSDTEYAALWGEPAPATAPPVTEEAHQIGTLARADAATRDGLARLVYRNPPTLGSLFASAVDVLRDLHADVLPGQVAAGRPGSGDQAEAKLAELAGVPVSVVRARVDDALRWTCRDNVQGHREALAALAYARAAHPMALDEELPQIADGILGTI
jgi:hypothetical protein